MSIRIGLTMSVMAACMLPGFANAEGGVQTQKDITWGLGLEIAQAAMYFLSDESRTVTGQSLAVDGGWSLVSTTAEPTP